MKEAFRLFDTGKFHPGNALALAMELFVKLFLKINPYGVHTHVITTYIDHIKKNMDANSLIKT